MMMFILCQARTVVLSDALVTDLVIGIMNVVMTKYNTRNSITIESLRLVIWEEIMSNNRVVSEEFRIIV